MIGFQGKQVTAAQAGQTSKDKLFEQRQHIIISARDGSNDGSLHLRLWHFAPVKKHDNKYRASSSTYHPLRQFTQ